MVGGVGAKFASCGLARLHSFLLRPSGRRECIRHAPFALSRANERKRLGELHNLDRTNSRKFSKT